MILLESISPIKSVLYPINCSFQIKDAVKNSQQISPDYGKTREGSLLEKK